MARGMRGWAVMTDTRDIERATAHRPWALPAEPWLMFQSWRDLLFMHWPVSAAALRALVPEPLVIDTHDGVAWVGVTPFRIAGLRAHMLPALPGLSNFPELNVRTYVRYGDKPGVWFFSLDTPNQVAVLGARIGYHLPYYAADLRLELRDGWHYCTSSRGDARLVVRYKPTGEATSPEAGSLDYFLTERYALFVLNGDGEVMRGDIQHVPWPLQPAIAELTTNTMAAAHGIALPDQQPMLHFALQQDTLIWRLRPA